MSLALVTGASPAGAALLSKVKRLSWLCGSFPSACSSLLLQPAAPLSLFLSLPLKRCSVVIHHREKHSTAHQRPPPVAGSPSKGTGLGDPLGWCLNTTMVGVPATARSDCVFQALCWHTVTGANTLPSLYLQRGIALWVTRTPSYKTCRISPPRASHQLCESGRLQPYPPRRRSHIVLRILYWSHLAKQGRGWPWRIAKGLEQMESQSVTNKKKHRGFC